MIGQKFIISAVILFNVVFILIAAYIAYDYDPKLVHDAYDVVSFIVR